MGRSFRRTLAAVCVGGGVLLAIALPAGADVIDPTGACTASGTWQNEGRTRASENYVPSDVVVIPQEDTVAWEGGIAGAPPGQEGPTERDISGEVEVDVAGVTTLEIDSWDGPSKLHGNSGEYDYEVPDVLVNVKMKLQGAHREPEGELCSGSVYIQVEGGTFSNPLAIAFLVLMVLTGAGLLYAGVVKKGVAG